MQARKENFSFRLAYKKWYWEKPDKKQYVIDLYCLGYNQIEIAAVLLMSPGKIRKILIAMRKSLEWNIKTYKMLEE